MRHYIYLFSLFLWLCYLNAYLYGFINLDFSRPTYDDDRIFGFVVIFFIPCYAFIAGLAFIEGNVVRKVLLSLAAAVIMFFLAAMSQEIYVQH
ncbi:hypothetical protein [Acinetobacter sp. c1-l78]|uniref:hypothetical protein n=1 Tax=Acinetobacter sp. c1-l78 TaxID=3342803 RepID=UPI0035BB99B4